MSVENSESVSTIRRQFITAAEAFECLMEEMDVESILDDLSPDAASHRQLAFMLQGARNIAEAGQKRALTDVHYDVLVRWAALS